RKMQPNKRMAQPANYSSNACWRSNMAWNTRALPRRLANRRSSRAICCGRTAKPIGTSGAGRTRSSIIAMLTGALHTVFGWHIHVGENPNPRMLRNFPMQANGAEMLRLACCLATERGIEVCAPVHDAVLICAPLDRLEEDIAGMRAAMAQVSK